MTVRTTVMPYRFHPVERVALSVRVNILALLLASSLVFGRTGVVLHPLHSATGNTQTEWMRFALPDLLFRSMSRFSGLQVWDPAFLFAIDSTGYTLDADSLIVEHWNRWQWDAAVGGAYGVIGDSTWFQIRLVRMVAGVPQKKVFVASGSTRQLPALFRSVFQRVLKQVGYEVDDENRREIDRLITRDMKHLRGYATYARAYGYEMTGEYENAISAYSRAAELLSSPGIAWSRIGYIYARGGRIALAREAFEKALSDMPRDPLVVAAAAGFFLDFDPPEKAIRYAENRRELLEKTALGLRVMGKLYLVKGEFQRAAAMLTRSIAFGASDLETDFLLGNTYFSTGQFDLASDIFNRLVQMRPDHLRYYMSLGAAYRKSGRLMESAQILENARKLAPENSTVLLNLANTYFGLGWHERSKQLLQRAKELDPELAAAHVNLAAVYWHLGLTQQAERMLEASARSSGHRQIALNNLGNMRYLAGDYRKALRAYRKADKSGKKNETVLFNIAQTLIRMGKNKQAVSYLQSVLQLSPSRLDALVQVASISHEAGDFRDAEVYYSRILDVEPTYEDALVGLVEILCNQDRCKAAIDYIEAYLERFPASKKARILLAETYVRVEWYEVAEMKYRELASDFPDEPQVQMGFAKSVYGSTLKREGKDADEAVAIIQRASKMNPLNPECSYMLAEVYLLDGKPQEASSVLKKALQGPMTRANKKKLQGLLVRIEKR